MCRLIKGLNKRLSVWGTLELRGERRINLAWWPSLCEAVAVWRIGSRAVPVQGRILRCNSHIKLCSTQRVNYLLV